MQADAPEFVEVDGRPIAYRRRQGAHPGVVWLGGYRSDMRGTKAEALDAWCARTDHAFLRHDYSGHGESGGVFEDGTIGRWVAESLAVFRRHAAGPQVLVGSSMGAWIALRMVQELRKNPAAPQAAGLLLIAPAPDFTIDLVEPRLSDSQRAELVERGYVQESSEYGPDATVYTRALIEDGRNNQVMGSLIDTHCPVHILQGMDDPDVPYAHALKLVEHLPADDVTLTLVRDGDHRLSRPQDIDLLLRTLDGMVERLG